MTVLITGMEMPKSCAKCDLFGEYGCPFIGAVGYALTRNQRNERCPLIEVLTPRTNGDKLRTMTDEEIIKFECSITACIYEADPDKQRSECHDFDCERCWRAWLKEEAE